MVAVLALGACSNWRLSDDQGRQPSLRIADAALASGAPEMALRIADLAIARQPGNTSALIARGDALYAMGQSDMAQQAYRAALAIDPGAVGAEVGLGRLLVRSDPRAAEAAFLKVLAHDPDNVIALNNLGVARDLRGRNGEAQEAYRHALKVSPASADVAMNLGMSLALSGHADEAVPLLRSIAVDPGSARAWRKELIAALTVAGDRAWAQQALGDGSGQPAPDAPPADDRVRMASAAVPAPDAAPRTPVAKAELIPAAPFLAADSVVALAANEPQAPPRDAATATPPTAIPAAMPPPAVLEPIMQVAAARPVASKPGIVARHDTATGGQATRSKADTAARKPYVQLASLLSEPGAMFEWRRLTKRISELLSGRQPTITRAEVHGRTYWRLRTFGFASLADARDLCNRLKAAGKDCLSGHDL